MRPRSLSSLLLLLLAIHSFATGCSSLRWRRSRPPHPTTRAHAEPSTGDGLERALSILHGSAPGILVAANGGLTNQRALPNSLAAIRAAIDYRLPMVVVDVCQTVDRVPVLDLDHMLSRPRPFREQWVRSDYEQLRAATAQAPNGPAATLTEAMDLARGRLILGLRLRSADLAAVAARIDEAHMTTQVVLWPTSTQQVQSATPLLQRRPPVPILFDAPSLERLEGIESTPPWPGFVQLGPETLSPANIARVQALGARVLVYQRGVLLVRIGSALSPYHRMGVTVILTDWPRQLMKEMMRINSPADGEAP